MKRAACALLCAIGCGRSAPPSPPPPAPADAAVAAAIVIAPDAGPPPHHLQHVFVIVMENLNWDEIPKVHAPYLQSLLHSAAYAADYHAPHGLHPSEPNYIWLEAGDNLGIHDDRDPSVNHRATHAHLTHLLDDAGLSWKAYEETTTGTVCPLVKARPYVPKHDAFVYFDDLTDGQRADSPTCIAHVRPLSELASDLQSDATTPRYAFLGPNECNDMHDHCGGDKLARSDTWLRDQMAMLQASPAWPTSVVFVTWDESEHGDAPIGLIAISPLAKPGFALPGRRDHSSTLKTVEEILGVTPLLGAAAKPETEDLAAMFTAFP